MAVKCDGWPCAVWCERASKEHTKKKIDMSISPDCGLPFIRLVMPQAFYNALAQAADVTHGTQNLQPL